MNLLSGKQPSQQIKQYVSNLMKSMSITPHLVIIKVGHDSASGVYIRNKMKACEELGILCDVWEFDENISSLALISRIECANRDPNIHAVMVQLPLPARLHQYEKDILSAINPKKDVDGLHPLNAGYLMHGDEKQGFVPCTPLGIEFLLDYYGIPLRGKHVVIVGRSDIVGRPLAMCMLDADATVTICHSKTQNLAEICRSADVLVTAIGKQKFFTKEYVKRNAVVIDVGINRDEDGKLCGDVDLDSIKDVAAAATPVPGGVGLMTVAALMYNCVRAVGEV